MTWALRAVVVAGLAMGGVASPVAQRSAPPSLAWQAVRDAPMGGTVTEFVDGSEGVLIARADDVLYRSRDDGRTWLPCRRLNASFAPPQSQPSAGEWLWHTIADAERGVARTGGLTREMRVSDRRCETFGVVPIPTVVDARSDLSFLYAGFDGAMLAFTPGGVFRASHAGSAWTQTLTVSGGTPCAAHAGGSGILLIAGSRLYRSADGGLSWAQVAQNPDAAAQSATGLSGVNPGLGCPLLQSDYLSTLFSAGPGGLWRSLDEGVSWTRVFTGRFTSLATRERRVWLRPLGGESAVLMRSDDEGTSWNTVPLPPDLRVTSRLMETHGGALLAATDRGVYRSEDGGQSWLRTGFERWNLSLAADNRRAYASDGSGVWTSVDGGRTWQRASANTVDGRPWKQGDLLTRVFDTGGERVYGVIERRLFASDDGGISWNPSGLDKDVLSLVRVERTWYAGTTGGVFRSADLHTWVECSGAGTIAGPLVVTGKGDLFTFGLRSIDGCRSWWEFPTEHSLAEGPFMFSVPSLGVITIGAGISRLDLTTKQWEHWKDATELTVTGVSPDRRRRYWMSTASGVYVLVIDGTRWNVWPMGLDGERILSLVVDPKGYLLAAVEGRGVFRAQLPQSLE